MFAVLILPFLRGITGATFFRHSDNSEQKLLCSVSSDQNKTGWWFGGTSLQQFGQPTDAYTSCGGTYNKTDPCYTEGKELVFKSPNGGSVACKSLADHETFNQVPLFTNEEDCKNFDFFIVAITQNKAAPVFRNVLELSLGVIGGLFLLSMIILFLCWKKKLRGKPLELHERDQSATEMDGEDCSPYAISSRNDPRGNEVIYSLAMSPGVNPNTDLALLEHKPASGRQPGEDLQAIYAVVKKN
ncbi:uncharacterized protein LOC121934657 isoform X3 [Sceloporus undulatus]|uniref:uncharacterized protein LOC121934657 isoform X3 n=1 Tax=Sceloporus undulatus TaxID=8520 RepID=UPI001C4CD022|nr:uncharacterized protein LOC121934657 isoform X3 [Sceloporus undulatus]